MFYCDPCGRKRGWPVERGFKSSGPCEICGDRALCNDVPSKDLPIPGTTMEETYVADKKAERASAKVVNIHTYRQQKERNRR